MIFKKQAEEDFNIQAAEFPEMEALINRCANIYRGVPEWLDDKNNIKTINFAKSVCSETARLATLAIGIQIDFTFQYGSTLISESATAHIESALFTFQYGSTLMGKI